MRQDTAKPGEHCFNVGCDINVQKKILHYIAEKEQEESKASYSGRNNPSLVNYPLHCALHKNTIVRLDYVRKTRQATWTM